MIGSVYAVGRLKGYPENTYALLTDLRPGEGEDGTCAYRVVAVTTSFEALMAAIRLLTTNPVVVTY